METDPRSTRSASRPTDPHEGTDCRPVDAVIFFWRPGCRFCSMLRRDLEAMGIPLLEVDIWQDERGAQAVRTITGGSETVPTIVVGDRSMVNPPASVVHAAVEELAPHLLGS